MYQKQIEQLVILQEVDDEIIILKQELEEAPRELTDLEERLEELRQQKDQIEEKLVILKEQQKRLEGEIEDDGAKIKKSKNKLMMASNTKEYHAMMREMDSMEKLNRMREEERAAVLEELERQGESTAEVDSAFAEVESEYNTKKSTLDERLKAAGKQLSKLEKKRGKACEVVPKPILSRYEFIRERMENPVIVPVDGGVCGGCHIMIPPQSYNELQKGKQILGCPNCQRLIYWVEHIPAEAAE